MSGYQLTLEAYQDLQDLAEYIAAENSEAAQRLLAALETAFDQLAAFPRTGHPRPDLAGSRPVLFWPVGAYLVIYRPDLQPIEIIAVVHGSRDIPRFLRSRPA
jgi:plasmid stabilization system protein ParE